MRSQMAMLTKSRALIKTLNPNSFKSITTFSFLNQEPLLAEPPQQQQPPPPPPPSSSFPPNPSSGSPLYNQNWRSPIPNAGSGSHSLIPVHLQAASLPQARDVNSLMNLFADWVTSKRWGDVKEVFEQWVRSLDLNGKPNIPNVELFNQYLRACLMCRASTGELLEVVESMEAYLIEPNTASYNLVLKSVKTWDWKAAESILERMLLSGKKSQPNDESFELVIGMLFQQNQFEAAMKYLELTLKSGNMLSSRVFSDCIRSCVNMQKLDTLVSVIEKCQATDHNKALLPNWNLCNTLAEVSIQNGNSKLAFVSLKFMARWMQRGEAARPPVFLSVNEGLVVKTLSAAGRTYDSTLLDASWAILKRSLREKKVPNPETYLAKINALASLGNLSGAFNALNELEKNHANSSPAVEDLLSPFTSLRSLVVACAQKGYETLDLVYYQLEHLSRADPPYKSVAALNCLILGCANIWDLDRAYQTFEAIGSSFELTPNIHSYNALMSAFGKLKKTQEAVRVFEHLSTLGLKPNATSYSLLVDAHLVNRDPKEALAVLEAMMEAGFEPSRATLLKVRRRSLRELDNETFDLVESIAKQCNIGLGTENRRNILFNLEYNTEFAS